MLFFRKTKSEKPGFINRVFAFLIDCLIVTAICMPITSITRKYSPTEQLIEQYRNQENLDSQQIPLDLFKSLKNDPYLIASQVIQLVILMLYILIFWVRYQATPGKMLVAYKIIDAKTGSKPSFTQYLLRLICYIIPISIFIALFNKDKRALHDYIAGTTLVKIQK